tara:strand:+ start:100 stop:2286 length:2187 start_codon:yes stop_codon:yes gene_type:complete
MKINSEIVEKHGLSQIEYEKICELMKREPNLVELGIFSAMWNEHCSYKSSRVHLKNLHTKGKVVIQGPGENAGVIDVGDDDVIVFKVESHNHPSFIEPYQGASTGVGGILRDIFTMGARPIANLNSIHFGAPEHPKTKSLLDGVVKGIGGYGNCMGIPTVAGEIHFDESYNGNILVNAMSIGLAKKNKIFYSKASGINKPVIYVGSKTGRDGIHGASMASAKFDDKIEEKKPTVQVGDPFTEKLLLEACQELMVDDSIIAIQDMGAAGLTSSSVEMAAKGKLGMELNLSNVPCRELNMTPYEMMLSESQERMLIILNTGKEEKAKKIFEKWNLDFSIIGKTTNTKKLTLLFDNKNVAEIPINFLSDMAPKYERKWKKTPIPKKQKISKKKINQYKILDIFKRLLSHHNICNKEWVWKQYDHTVMGDTIMKPGSDCGIVRIHKSKKAIASTIDSSPEYCEAHPITGGKQVVCESWRNLITVGAKPLAITNCLNFGNPEKEKAMGEFVECVQGITEASKYLDFPVVSGNVSFYNETNDKSIKPTPTIGGVGLIKDTKKIINLSLKNEKNTILVVGKTTGHIEQTLFAREILGNKKGPPPEINLFNEKNNGHSISELIDKNLILSCHDISVGGLLINLAEMCIAGNMGVSVNMPKSLINPIDYFFSEDQSRYIIEIDEKNLENVTKILSNNSVFFENIGKTQKEKLTLNKEFEISINDIKKINNRWFKKYI